MSPAERMLFGIALVLVGLAAATFALGFRVREGGA
jgi:hypothetical protein